MYLLTPECFFQSLPQTQICVEIHIVDKRNYLDLEGLLLKTKQLMNETFFFIILSWTAACLMHDYYRANCF